MPQILIRDLDRKTVSSLKKRARRKGRSLQSEAKIILSNAAQEESKDLEAVIRKLERFRSRFKGRKFSDSAELIREDRDR